MPTAETVDVRLAGDLFESGLVALLVRGRLDRLDRPAGTFSAAHFHPRFDGVEPSDRVFGEELTADPWAWAAAQLSDLDAVAVASGLPPDAVGDDAGDVREQVALIVDTARSLAPTECHSRDQCFRMTHDVAEAVRIMVDNLVDRPCSIGYRPSLPTGGDDVAERDR